MRFLKPLALGIVCFVLGVAVTRYYDLRRPVQTAQTTMPQAEIKTEEAKIDLQNEPIWAFGFDKPAMPGEKAAPQAPPNRNLRPNQDAEEQTRLRHLAGSKAAYSLVDVRDGQNVIDWFPEDHPRMPSVVQHGPERLAEKKRGCGSCHLANGKGRPENAGVAGLPVSYFMRQIQNFRSGKRHSSDPRKPNTNTMIELAKSLTDDELKAAAEYFGSMKWTPWIKVVETDLVPRTHFVGNLSLPLEEEKTEAIGRRIVEMPENEEQAETYRNPHSGFVAYVPVGSMAKGKDLVTTGGARIVGGEFVRGKSTPCITCHGEDLMGVGDSPPIAGRSPSYMVRQIWDIQQGTRNSEEAQLMKLGIANLTPDDMIAVAAYVASRKPVYSAPKLEGVAVGSN
jgi:cytochrome c553